MYIYILAFICICELVEEWNDKDKEKFEANTQFLREWKDCRLLKMLPELPEIYASNFTDIGTLIEKGEYQEAVRRHIFIKRVLQDHHERIDDETKARLAETIYHLDKDTANELARQSGNCIGYYFAMLALLDYQSQDVSIKWDLKNIIPTEYMAILSISNNSKKISKLKTKLENAELYRVLGWKAADFDKKIMGIQSF